MSDDVRLKDGWETEEAWAAANLILIELGIRRDERTVNVVAKRVASLLRNACHVGMLTAADAASAKAKELAGPAGQRTDRGLAGSNALTDFADELAARVPHHPENAG